MNDVTLLGHGGEALTPQCRGPVVKLPVKPGLLFAAIQNDHHESEDPKEYQEAGHKTHGRAVISGDFHEVDTTSYAP